MIEYLGNGFYLLKGGEVLPYSRLGDRLPGLGYYWGTVNGHPCYLLDRYYLSVVG